MKKIIITALMCMMALTMQAQQYVDLGLPSGTQWKKTNESGFYTYGAAITKFDGSVPSWEQWKELVSVCDWSWTGNGYKVVGPNGNFIVLPALGWRLCDGKTDDVGTIGHYWTSTPLDLDNYARHIHFTSDGVDVNLSYYRCSEQSIRLVR